MEEGRAECKRKAGVVTPKEAEFVIEQRQVDVENTEL